MRFAPGLGVLDLPFDHHFKTRAQIEWCDEQLFVVRLRGIAREVVEQIGYVIGDVLVASEHADIGVEMRRDGIVVAGREVDIAA